MLSPQYGFGNLAPTPAAIPTLPEVPATPPAAIGLEPLAPGAIPIQAQNIRAPPILIIPTLSLSEGYTDNPRFTHNTLSDSISRFNGGVTASFDTARLQGQLSGSVDYTKYARATDEDSLNANLLAFGLGTIVRDHVYVDARAAVTPLSTTGGIGFANPSTLPKSQQTQSETISLTPILRGSYDGYVDSELRYNLGLSMFQNGGLLRNSTSALPGTATSLSNTTTNEATLTFATGRRFAVFGSQLTLDATNVDSQSTARSTQLRAIDDLAYKFNNEFTALAGFGYEKLDYPLQPSANVSGPVWHFGGQITAPGGSYLSLTYGRQGGFNGVNGELRYQLTAATTLLASAQQGLTSSQGQILSNLNSSQLNSSGILVDTRTGLPSNLSNPSFNLKNTIEQRQTYQIGMQTNIGRNTFGVFIIFAEQSPPAPAISTTGGTQSSSLGADSSTGINLTWNRALTERLSSAAALGYTTTALNHDETLTASWSLRYAMNQNLNVAVDYQFINNDSPVTKSTTATGSYRRNLVELVVTRSF